MPLTQIDPIAALVVIDLQKGIVNRPAIHSPADIVARTAQLARAFRLARLPVVLVNVSGVVSGRTDAQQNFNPPPDWTELAPELERQPSDHLVTKQRWGAFLGTSLDAWLKSQGATQILLTGIATSIGVESTARNAHELGYHVVLVEDAMTDFDAEAHRLSIEKIFPRLGQVTNAQAVLEQLRARAARNDHD